MALPPVPPELDDGGKRWRDADAAAPGASGAPVAGQLHPSPPLRLVVLEGLPVLDLRAPNALHVVGQDRL